MSTTVIILAAGKGTRMRSSLPKVLQPLAGRPLLGHVIDTAKKLNAANIITIYGHGGARVQETFTHEKIEWVEQAEQLGTGHAVQMTLPVLPQEGSSLILSVTAQEWQEALILMKTHQMIELPSAIGNLEDDSPIYIYSTINIFCSAADINELVEMFKGETGETEEQKEAEYSEKTQDQWETQDEMRSE